MQCNGSCHLAKQLSIASDIKNESTDFSLLAEAFYPLYFQNLEYRASVNSTSFKLKHYWNYCSIYLNYYTSKNFKPPQLIVEYLGLNYSV